jgi:hypothetical protein
LEIFIDDSLPVLGIGRKDYKQNRRGVVKVFIDIKGRF